MLLPPSFSETASSGYNLVFKLQTSTGRHLPFLTGSQHGWAHEASEVMSFSPVENIERSRCKHNFQVFVFPDLKSEYQLCITYHLTVSIVCYGNLSLQNTRSSFSLFLLCRGQPGNWQAARLVLLERAPKLGLFCLTCWDFPPVP